MTCPMPGRFALNGALLQVIAVLDIAADAREVAHARTWSRSASVRRSSSRAVSPAT